MPKFSLVIPVYNVEEYITRCLDSIAAQTYSDFEAIIIDDCGSDNSIQIAQTYAQKDSRFKIFKHTENKGTGVSRNDGIDLAKGEYVCFVDPDDWIETDYLESINQTFLNNPDINWVLFKYKEELDKKMKTLRFSVSPRYFRTKSSIQFILPNNIFNFTAFCWAKAYRLNWLKEKNIRYAKTTYEETLFYLHCFLEDSKVFILDKFLYNYTIRPDSWTTSEKIEDIKNNIKSLEYLMEYVPKLIEQRQYDNEYLQPCLNFIKQFYDYQFSRIM